MSEYAKICGRLKELRARHGVTQEEFAEVAGFSYKFYQQIEAGRKVHMWLETAERLAEAYGIELWELIGPEMPTKTKLRKKPSPSKIHYKENKKTK